MGRREARALGAGDFVEVRGKRYTLHPVAVRQLAELEVRALRFFQRQYMKSLQENASVLGEKEGQKMLMNKVEEIARWDVGDLPYKNAYDVSEIPVTDELKKWLVEQYGDIPEGDSTARAVVNMALESSMITVAQVKELAGKSPRRIRVRYDQWWVSASVEGMTEFVLTSLQCKQPNMTIEDIGKWPLTSVAEASRIAEHLTTVDLGNG